MKQLRFKTLLSLLALMTALFATSLTAQAQLPAVSIDVKNVSVKELLKTIEAKSGYTFAYVDSEVDLNKNTIFADREIEALSIWNRIWCAHSCANVNLRLPHSFITCPGSIKLESRRT